jgi:hypothetical protein
MGSDNDICTTAKIQIRDSDVLNFSIKLFILKFIIILCVMVVIIDNIYFLAYLWRYYLNLETFSMIRLLPFNVYWSNTSDFCFILCVIKDIKLIDISKQIIFKK